jgi:long-chain acyl-CoA synthetase
MQVESAKPKRRTSDFWKESLLNYFLSDLGMELNQSITLPRVFLRAAAHYHSKTALMEKRGGEYQPMSYSELSEAATAFAAALIQAGVKLHDRVAIFLRNSPAWVISDFGTMLAGGTTVPIYETLIPSAIRHILRDSGTTAIVVENEAQFKKIREIRPELPELRLVILRKTEGVKPEEKVLPFEDFLKSGKELLKKDPQVVSTRLEELKRDDIASIVYTSGTTGDPKGVMLTHRNFLSNVYGVVAVTDITANDILLSILPLSHAFERTAGYYVPVLFGATIAYAESIDTVSQNLAEIRPTICCAVPRLFEKIYSRLVRNMETASPLKRRLFHWALLVGRRVWDYRESITRPPVADRRQRHRPEDRYRDPEIPIKNPLLQLSYALVDRLVYRKLRQAMGGRLRFFVSGGAPLSKELINFFRNLHISIYEGYGLSEASPIVSFNYQNKFRAGTVGKLLPYVQVKLSPEGEILVKGPNVMRGYYNNPQATAEAIDPNGWLYTGDVGVFDHDNYLQITDRIKELIVMSNGKNVAPLPIENRLTQSPFVANAMVIGNNRKYIAALIFPNFQEVKELAKKDDLPADNIEALCANKKIVEKYAAVVQAVNQELSRYEQIKKFELVPQELTIENGDITPTMKLKRRILEKKYNYIIEKLYREE